jgi:hypothetical protein
LGRASIGAETCGTHEYDTTANTLQLGRASIGAET